MILSDSKIMQEIKKGTIVITPFNPDQLGSNSYDCLLSKNIAVYVDDAILELSEHELFEKCQTNDLSELLVRLQKFVVLDAKKHNKVRHFEIPAEGVLLQPHGFYLGSTVEYTETHKHVPYIEGKSSTGRLGIDIHATAGKGDVGFCGHWTLEISVKQPVRVYADMPIGQLIYFPVDGDVLRPYNKKTGAKYSGQPGKPIESMMWKNTF